MSPEPLGSLLGRETGRIPVAPRKIFVGIPADLLRRNPSVRAAELKAAAQSAQIGVAQSDLYPAISLTGVIGGYAATLNGHYLGQVFTAPGLTYSFGPSFQWNILNYGQITNNVRLQDATLQQYLVNYQNSVLTAQQNVENGISTYLQSKIQVADLRYSVKAANGALSLSLLEYQQGTRDYTTVLTSEQNLLTAETDLAVAEGNVPLGVAAVYEALGGGWQIREGNDFVPPATNAEMRARTNWGTCCRPPERRRRAAGAGRPDAGTAGAGGSRADSPASGMVEFKGSLRGRSAMPSRSIGMQDAGRAAQAAKGGSAPAPRGELGKARFSAMAAAMRTADRIRTTLLASGAGRRFAVVALMAAMSGAACGAANAQGIINRAEGELGQLWDKVWGHKSAPPPAKQSPAGAAPQAPPAPASPAQTAAPAAAPVPGQSTGQAAPGASSSGTARCAGASRPCAESSRRDAAAGNSRGAAEGRNRDRLCRGHRDRGLDQYRQIDRARRRLS